MSFRRFLFALLLSALVLLALGPSTHPADADDLLHVTSNVSYRIQPDPSTGSGQALGPVHVSWQVTLKNNDPQTARAQDGTTSFYNSFSVAIFRGATNLSAFSPAATPLKVTVNNSQEGPLVSATVTFERRLFYQETYSFTLEYDLPTARHESVLVTPFYVFLPLIVSGDEATVAVSTPTDPTWVVTLELKDCTQSGSSFACSSRDSLYLAAFAEVSRPDATATTSMDLALKEKAVSVTLTYFRGEEGWAQHVQELIWASLPVIEGLYGFPYPGPFTIKIAMGGRQAILDYAGLTTCDPQAGCAIAISPLADDFAILHELAHLWSGIYTKRWISEGFAELIGDEAAAHLPSGLLQGGPPSHPESTLDIRLDAWGNLSSITVADDAERATEDAGYYRSWRFLLLLRAQVGLEALQQANAAIAKSDHPVDSRRFMDTLEDVSGQNLDQLFADWVFPDSMAPTLVARRQARERLAALTAQAQSEGLSSDVPDAIRKEIDAWRFEEALAALDRAEIALQTYAQIKDALSALRRDVRAADLSFPQTIDDTLGRWDFEAARLAIATAGRALEAYTAARQEVDAPRSLWRRLGLLGSDPNAALERAAQAFSRGEFEAAVREADVAADTVDDASHIALQRLLIFIGILVAVSMAVVVVLGLSRRGFRR